MGTLLDKTLDLLQEDPRSLQEVSQETGISLYWLQKMKVRSVPDPSVNRIQDLYEYLSNNKLKV